jgi:hypothetical protein
VSQKSLLFLVVLALVGIAYYVRFRPHRTHGNETDQPKGEYARCGEKCLRASVKCTAQCGVDEACSKRCDNVKDRCVAAACK